LQYTSNRPSTLQRTTSQGGAGAPLQKRVRSKHGENRNENNRVLGSSGAQGHGSGFNNNMIQMQNFDPVVLLQVTENRWDRKAIQDSPELVERTKVKGLLNKLTMEKFASISDQIIAWANKSEKEKDGQTLIHDPGYPTCV
jgi:translation initiation factor 4G